MKRPPPTSGTPPRASRRWSRPLRGGTGGIARRGTDHVHHHDGGLNANDYGYDVVFTRQVEALGAKGDIAFGISTSGNSANVQRALTAAKKKGMTTIARTGRDGGVMGREADIHLNDAEKSTPRIQEVHRTMMHAMCALVDAMVVAATGKA